MKYPNITALVPKGEDFVEAAFITNEAGWLTTAHIAGIEAALAGYKTNEGIHQQTISEAGEAARTAQETISNLNGQLQTDNETITALNEQVSSLSKAAAGDFSKTIKTESDPVPGGNDMSQYLTSVDLEKQRMNKMWAK